MPGSCAVALAAGRLFPHREPVAVASHRRRLLHRAVGDTLDLSPGWQADRTCFRPGAVTSLHVLECPSVGPRPLEWADDPAAGVPRVLSSVPEPDSFDTVVVSMALCGVDRLTSSLDDIHRWLRPGGQLLALEHVRGVGLTGLAQRIVSPLSERAGATCRLDQDLAAALRAGGYELTDAARFTARLVGGLPVPFMAAVARPAPVSRRSPVERRSVAPASRPGPGSGRSAAPA